MTNPQSQLNELIAHLEALTDILALDPDSHWGTHFRNCLTTARALAGSSHDGDELTGLACSVMSVYGGMGSFNDYAPWQNGRFIAGMESLDEASNRVYMAARAIRLRNATDVD
ncbi:hypothetical protein FB481_10630 [Pseudomonas sp. AG1028]|uniref:DUF6966 domain-containing protein n=1 Tax=Pseudomonas sp. AG1028 TaxID=2572911 RepID=UPI0011AC00EA|nr:hypothetical protein [Pseudomonas sp. AG1028]TWE05657.1 hypothetical protein FB481_10630 [Pseudomonas sp. AG1028]